MKIHIFSLRYIVFLQLFAVNSFSQQDIKFIIQVEKDVPLRQYLVIDNHQFDDFSPEKNENDSKKSITVQNLDWVNVEFNLTSNEDFKVQKNDLLFVENLPLRESKKEQAWYAAVPSSGSSWLGVHAHWRSATPTHISNLGFSKQFITQFYNLHIASYYVYANKRLLALQVAYQPTSTYKDRILNPMLTSFPPPLHVY